MDEGNKTQSHSVSCRGVQSELMVGPTFEHRSTDAEPMLLPIKPYYENSVTKKKIVLLVVKSVLALTIP